MGRLTTKDGSTSLKLGTDYVITSDPGMPTVKNVGLYGIYIDSPLTSKYSIHETKLFKVNPKGTKITKLTASKKGFKAIWKKQANQTTGYQIRYSLKKSMKGAKIVTVSKTKTVSKKITKLKARKKYYVQIRTYKTVNGQKYYSAWSKEKTIKTQ